MTERPNSLMIFAAGFGTRMGRLTRDMPKPMLPLGGKPMIDQAIRFGRDVGADPIVANTHYLHDKIAPHLDSHGVTVRHEQGDILDTGGGLKAAAPLLSSPTWTLNPDAVFVGPNPLTELTSHWRLAMSALLLLVPVKQVASRTTGDFDIGPDGRIRRGDTLVYTGAQIIRPETTQNIEKEVFSLNLVWDQLGKSGGLFGAIYPGDWYDIGTEDGLIQAENALVRSHV